MCPIATSLTLTVLGSALMVALVAGAVGHGVLRPMMEARGVSPWLVKDSLGTLPLVLIGSATIGGALAVFAAWGVAECSKTGWAVTLVSGAILAGALMIRLGLLALRKLV